MQVKVVYLLIVLFVASSPSGRAQSVLDVAQTQGGVNSKSGASRRITATYESAPLTAVLKDIAMRARVRVNYRDNDLQGVASVTLKLKDVAVEDAFSQALQGTKLVATKLSFEEWTVVPKRAVKSVVQGVIAGKVMDAKIGRGLSGVTVSVADKATRTAEDGSYQLAGVSSGAHTVIVRLVGYAKQTRSVIVGDGATAIADFKLEPSASVLDQVVVTGTVVASELRSVPNAITVVTAKQIEERGITRIDQLFRGDIPGLFSLNRGSSSPLDEVVMFSRGATALTTTSAGTDFGTNPIKTYIDGVEMVDPQYLSQIDPGSIERIEILTGPQASTIYGSNAINGVMQIFTKRGGTNKPKLALSLNGGITQNSFSNAVAPNYLADASIAGADGRFSYNVGSSWNYAGAWTPGKQTQRLSAYGGIRTDLGKLATDFSARQGLTRNKKNGSTEQGETALLASGVYSPNASQGAPNPETRILNGRTIGVTLSYRPYSWWSHEMVLGSDASATEQMETAPGFFSSGVDTTLFISVVNTARRSERYSSTVQLPVSSLAKFNLAFGADHWRTSGSVWQAFPTSLTGSFSSVQNVFVSRNRPDKNKGAFLQGQLGFFDALFFTYGVRADWNPNFGDNVKVKPGRYGVSYTREMGHVSTKFRGSYGRSIRPPEAEIALGQTAAQWGFNSAFISQFGNFDYIKPNPALGPEHQQGGEGGIELYFGSRGSLVITRFNQTVDNLIDQVQGVDSTRSLMPVFPSTTNCARDINGIRQYDDEGHCFFYSQQFLNVGSIRNQGWETQASVNIGPLTTKGTYSWTKSRILGITPKYRSLLTGFEPGEPFRYMPEHTWALGLTYAQSRSTVSLSVNGVGMRYVLSSALNAATSSSNRFHTSRPRIQSLFGIYRSLEAGYAMVDLNATHRFSSCMDAILQITNVTDYYQNDYSAGYASPGRSSRVGVRLRW